LQSLIRVRLNDLTRGQLSFSTNTFENLTVSRGEQMQPNETLPLVAIRDARHLGIEVVGDRYVGVKAYKVLSVKEAAVLNMEGVGFEELRTGEVCNGTREENAVTSFINLVNVTKVSLSQITYDKVTLGKSRVLHRMTDCEDTVIRDSKYRRIEYFDESRLGVFQDYQRLIFQNNLIEKVTLHDDRSKFLFWGLLTLERDVGISTKFLDNVISVEPTIGFLKLENHLLSTQIAPLTLDAKNNTLPLFPPNVAANSVKLFGKFPLVNFL
jgi:hypothetical protein